MVMAESAIATLFIFDVCLAIDRRFETTLSANVVPLALINLNEATFPRGTKKVAAQTPQRAN